MFWGWRVLSAATMVFTAAFVAPGQAAACACGGFVSPDSRLTAVEETALVEVDALAAGRVAETMTLNLGLRSDTKVTDAAFVMPVPGPAQFALAEKGLFAKLDQLTAPVYQEEVHYRPFRLFPDIDENGQGGAAAATMAAQSKVVVTDRIVLGPYDVVTLTGSDASAVRNWLRDNGFELSAALGEGLAEYLAKGWQIVAVKLTSEAGLQGVLPPMRITFDSDEIVYPMRLSAHAKWSEPLRIYVLADHRAVVTNPDPGHEAPQQFFAGWVNPQDLGPVLRISGRRYLTRYDQTFYPVADATDVKITAASDDVPYRTIIHTEIWRDSPWQAPLRVAVFLGLPVVAAALGVFLFSRRAAKR